MTDIKKIAPYGSWRSSITSEKIISSGNSYTDLHIEKGVTYWIEMRPQEEGRCVIVQRSEDNSVHDVIPKPFSARTTVHEYGGGSFTTCDEVIYFVNFADQKIYRYGPKDQRPIAITNDEGDIRYANFITDRKRRRLISIEENHTAKEEAINTLVSIPINGDGPKANLTSGADFYSSPVLNPSSNTLAWVQWNHPNMPWDETELWIADITTEGMLSNKRKIRGEPGESICHPLWSPDGILHFVSDLNGWWNIYRIEKNNTVNVTPVEAEFTQAQWGLGSRYYGFTDKHTIAAAMNKQGIWELLYVDIPSKKFKKISSEISDIGRSGIKVASSTIIFEGARTNESFSLFLHNRLENIIKLTSNEIDGVSTGDYSIPTPITYATSSNDTSHAFYYAPQNSRFKGPDVELPPLIVMSHGGPTGATNTSLNLQIQYWTSRGFAVVDVNYRGSTGYGTKYRRQIDGNWGIVDVEDCINSARFLIGMGAVDSKRIGIRGGSAGGYTTLSSLVKSNVFCAGASYYGVSDLRSLAKDTHKFESRYLDSLIGPYPENEELYRSRSPLFNAEEISCPVILFQGLEDRIVPPNQSESMMKSLKERNVPVTYIEFQGEQHGFRKSETIKKALYSELKFYSQVFGFPITKPF